MNSGEKEVIKTSIADARFPSMVVSPLAKFDPCLMDSQSSIEIEDMCAGCPCMVRPFVVATHWVKVEMVNFGEMKVI